MLMCKECNSVLMLSVQIALKGVYGFSTQGVMPGVMNAEKSENGSVLYTCSVCKVTYNTPEKIVGKCSQCGEIHSVEELFKNQTGGFYCASCNKLPNISSGKSVKLSSIIFKQHGR